MKALVGAFNQEKALVGAFSVIVQQVADPMDRFAALIMELEKSRSHCGWWRAGAGELPRVAQEAERSQ